MTKAQYEKALAEHDGDITAYRVIEQAAQPAQPTKSEAAQPTKSEELGFPKFCESVMRQMPGTTIEQRIAELRDMERNLAEFRARLTDDLHALGITWLDGAVVEDEP